jgi:tRNA (guanine37-N1)-methyltransferase
MIQKKITYDLIGDIAILKFPFEWKSRQKKSYAKKFLKENKCVETVLDKSGKIKGRLRKTQMSYVAGKKKRKTLHKENHCSFVLDVDEAYFSPRLSNERKIISEEIVKKVNSKKKKILIMFAGVAPFPVVIAKRLREERKKGEIISNELNRKANEYASDNISLNRLGDYVKIVQGDSAKLFGKLKEKFDFIVMPRPNLKGTFLHSALKLSKKGTRIYYYGFGDKKEVLEEIKRDAGKKIGQIKIRPAGEIAPYKFRWLAEFIVK